MLQFRVVNYGKMLYESLRAYFSINSSGNLSQLYLFLLACLYPLQPAFDDYDTFRIKKQIIANCKWQIGQLTNVLNYFFDPVSKRITITQSVLASVDDPVFMETPINFDPEYPETTTIFEPIFRGLYNRTNVTFNVPSTVDQSELISIIEQIKINGINYSIHTIS